MYLYRYIPYKLYHTLYTYIHSHISAAHMNGQGYFHTLQLLCVYHRNMHTICISHRYTYIHSHTTYSHTFTHE